MTMQNAAGDAPILVAEKLAKRFGPTYAVRNIDLEVRTGEVLGLVGENGAGKSTLLSLISGTLQPDHGRLLLHGEETVLPSYHRATRRGIFRVYQHQALVPNMSVAENIYLAQEARFSTGGVLSRARMERAASNVFADLGVELSVRQTMQNLTFAERQVVEIVRCLAQARLLDIKTPVILLDEPTSALTRGQIDFFFDFVHRIKHQAAQVFVSHRLVEVMTLCDRLVVLKDGEVVATNDDPGALNESQIHHLMVGRTMATRDRARGVEADAAPVLELDRFAGSHFEDVSLKVRAGEVVGLAGVVGSGKSELGRGVFELGAGCQGELRLSGAVAGTRGARAGVRASVGYVPPERHLEGVILGMSVADNHSLPYVGAALSPAILSGRDQSERAQRMIQRLRVKTPSVNTVIKNLSGGNQQKVVLGRWLTLAPKLLVLDNPTNGVDVGAKDDIYDLIEEFTAAGTAVLLISDDLPELLSLSDRVIVMKDGRIRAEHGPDAIVEPDAEVRIVAEMV